jgi:hypothetical protein
MQGYASIHDTAVIGFLYYNALVLDVVMHPIQIIIFVIDLGNLAVPDGKSKEHIDRTLMDRLVQMVFDDDAIRPCSPGICNSNPANKTLRTTILSIRVQQPTCARPHTRRIISFPRTIVCNES